MKPDIWEKWWREHPKEEMVIDDDMPVLEKKFRENNVSRILDAGCGDGKRHVIYFAKKGFEVYGFDISSLAIEYAKKKLKRENLYADLRIWDMTNKFPYDNEFFDAVISRRVIHHCSDMETIKKIVTEIYRVTKNNGYVYIQVPTYERILNLIKRGDKFKEIGPRTYEPLDGEDKGIPHHYFTNEELLGLFRSYLIEDIYIIDDHYCLLVRKRT